VLANRLNRLLRELNPVWRNFTPESIRRGDESPGYGPSAREVALRIAVKGRAEVRAPELRRLHVPELAIVPWHGAVEIEGEPVPPSDEEAERLRMLGYLE
jgi:hypothetical protein